MAYSGGLGTESSPYLIGSVADFTTLQTTTSDYDKYFELANGIDFENADFTAIGDDTNSFTGHFDFKNYVIANLNITTLAEYTGLFGHADGATFLNANLQSCTINVGDSTSENYIGLLCAEANNCTITNCSVNGDITTGKATDCGGVLGKALKNSVITECRFEGNITSGGMRVGGFIGFLDATGGAVVLNECYSNGIITTVDSEWYSSLIGGFVGYTGGCSINDCYSQVNIVVVSSDTYERCGGFVGGGTDIVCENCYCKGTISSEAYRSKGFCYLNTDGTFTSCYYDSTVSGLSDTGQGTPKTTTEMKTQSTFEDYDFADTWDIDNDYPTLKYLADESYIYSNSYIIVNNSNNVVLSDVSLTGIGLNNGVYCYGSCVHIKDSTISDKPQAIYTKGSTVFSDTNSGANTAIYNATEGSRIIKVTDGLSGTESYDSTSSIEEI